MFQLRIIFDQEDLKSFKAKAFNFAIAKPSLCSKGSASDVSVVVWQILADIKARKVNHFQ